MPMPYFETGMMMMLMLMLLLLEWNISMFELAYFSGRVSGYYALYH